MIQIIHGLSPGQVLQRLRNQTACAVVTGACDASGPVTATVTTRGRRLQGWRAKRVGRSAKGRFTARLTGLPVGGPYDITLMVDQESTVVRRVSVGDVWLLAGQSNMQGVGNLDVAPAPHPRVHAMYMDDRWDVAREPIHFMPDSPDPVHNAVPLPPAERERMRAAQLKGVGPGMFFGKEMVKRSGGRPQGLLCTAHGGTSMEQWDPALKKLGGASLYGSMLRTLRQTGQPIAGVVWYQGESDANPQAVPHYTKRMIRFVRSVRRDLRQPDLPFLVVQIGRVYGIGWDARPWNAIQDQQRQLAKRVQNLECVSALDLPLEDMIHISTEGYARLGVRLARLADRLVYGNRTELPAPELLSIRRSPCPVDPFRLELSFRNVVGGLHASGEPTGFALVDENHRDQRAFYKTTLDANRVYLESNIANETGALQLMYGAGTSPYVNITDGRDMPMPGFGPLPTGPKLALTPYLTRWLVSAVQPATPPVVESLPPHPDATLELERKEWSTNFVDQHPVWEGKSGQCVFFSEIKLSEPMKLNARLGYDGPIKVWIDEKEFYRDPNGTNPAIPDAVIRPLALTAGTFRIAVAMDLNGGRSWGFFLRFERRGLSQAKISKGGYALPTCSLA